MCGQSTCEAGSRKRVGITLATLAIGGALALGAPNRAAAASTDSAGTDTVAARAASSGFSGYPPGTPLRIEIRSVLKGIAREPGPMFKATLLRATADSLWVTRGAGGATIPLSLEGVHVDAYGGRSSLRGALYGAGIGLLAGLGAGLAVAAIGDRENDYGEFASLAYLAFPIAGAAIGVPTGLVIGGVRGADRWVRLR
jgi:hypothetical protein